MTLTELFTDQFIDNRKLRAHRVIDAREKIERSVEQALRVSGPRRSQMYSSFLGLRPFSELYQVQIIQITGKLT